MESRHTRRKEMVRTIVIAIGNNERGLELMVCNGKAIAMYFTYAVVAADRATGAPVFNFAFLFHFIDTP